jgi:hypothetical protein
MRAMKHLLPLALPLLAIPLGGCVASMAASAVGAAVSAIDRGNDRVVTADMRTVATEACRARAAPSGTVSIIDAEQRTDGRVTVWGTIEAGTGRRSFECVYNQRIVAFRLRELPTR